MTNRPWVGTLLLGGTAFAILALLYAATHPDLARPNREIFPEMVHSRAYESYAPNPNFPDGRTLQVPPEGTIARGGLVQADPETDPARAREEGRIVFARICAPCHGPGGAGDGPIARRGFPPPPDLRGSVRVRAMSDSEIVELISLGRGNMPALAEQTTRIDRLRVARYARSLAEPAE